MEITPIQTSRLLTWKTAAKTAPVCAVICAIAIGTAPDTASRLVAAGMFALVIAAALIVFHHMDKITRTLVDRQNQLEAGLLERLDQSFEHWSEIIEQLRANPATSAEGQRAVDTLRNIWGEDADQWFGRSPLN